MSVNWRVSAAIHKLPACLECDAEPSAPCVTPSGFVRAPHAVRLKVHDGAIIVISAAEARRARVIRAVRELAATVGAKPRRRA